MPHSILIEREQLFMKVVEANEVTDELVEAFTRLIPQLSSKSRIPSASELGKIVSSDTSTLLLAYDDDRIVGSLTLVMFRIPTGLRAWIEDVVVDETARRQGVAEALNREALRRATEAGARTVELCSRPSREAAIGLYQKLGFKERDTNVYRFEPRSDT
jgi:ribosomal protein S18 acetylase RimI-like enzyme